LAKYSLEFKLKVVKYILDEKNSSEQASKIFDVPVSPIKRWVKRYEIHGSKGLLMKQGSYTGDFKLNVIEYMHDNHMSINEAAAHFGIPSDATVGKWERTYYEEGSEALFRDNRGRTKGKMKTKQPKKSLPKSTEEDLIAEVQRLRMENEYLKKLNALVQKKEESAKKTKQ